MPILKRDTKPLLRTVGNKRHAGDDDHEDLKAPSTKKRTNGLNDLIKRKEEKEKQTEAAINASPQSSDNELATPPVARSRISKFIPPSKHSEPDGDLNKPQATTQKRRNPRQSLNALSSSVQALNEQAVEDKENDMMPPASSAGSAASGFDFGMQFSSQGSNKGKRSYGKQVTRNIHVLPQTTIKTARTFMKKPGKMQYGSKAKTKAALDVEDISDSSDCSMKSVIVQDGQDTELRMKKSQSKRSEKKKNKKTPDEPDVVRGRDDPDLQGPGTKTRASLKNVDSSRLLGRLNNWAEAKEPVSSQSGFDDLDEYMQQLPDDEEEGGQCPLCKEPVEMEDYWEFWKGKDKTVKNHTAFCVTHRKKSALEEYRQCGYPEIDWSNLQQRIRQHRMTLYQVLAKQQPSDFRERYEPLALTGKAAAVPTRRKDLPDSVQEELDSYALDDQSTYPGYYGPHGRRMITEHIMKVLKNEIKNCKDPVVQGSGPAAFVQAVLVPEAAVLLIMDDCKVDWEKAEEIREQTYEMGMLLHEEIEDELEMQHESEDENDYQDR